MNNAEKIKPVKIAIAGSGGITAWVLKFMKFIPELDVQIVQDINPEAAQKTASKFVIPMHTTSFSDILRDDIELVVINTPNDCHRDMAIEAFKAGKHCFVQKPLARNISEALGIIEASKKAGKMLGVVMLERGHPIYRQMKSMVQAGCFGTITSVRGAMGHVNHLLRPPPSDDWRCKPDKIGGGSFIQLAVHHIDLAQYILDQDITEVTALSSSLVDKTRFPSDESASGSVKFSSGIIGNFISSFTTVVNSFEIYGTKGMIRRIDEEIRWRVCKPFDGELWSISETDNNERLNLSELEPQLSELTLQHEPHRKFAHAIRGIAPLEVSGEDGLKELAIVEAVHRSIEERRTIIISPL